MRRLYRFVIRISAFVTKEIREILRQPWLVLSLILGPFFILALFGIGYRGGANILRAVVVVPPDSQVVETVTAYAESLGEQLQLIAVEQDEALAVLLSHQDDASRAERYDRASALLERYNADVVTSYPPDAVQRITNGQQAPLVLYYDTVDPLQAQYIASFGLIYTYEINRRVLSTAAEQGRGQASTLTQQMAEMRSGFDTARRALQSADRVRSGEEIRRLSQNADRLSVALETGVGLLARMEATLGGQAAGATEARATAEQLREDLGRLRTSIDSAQAYDPQDYLNRLNDIERALSRLLEYLTRFQNIPPTVLTAPFVAGAENVGVIRPNFVTFYAPGVLALMIQHLAVSMAALSLVRERMLGSIEVFRVGPMSALEALLGKYISYTLLVLVIGVVLLVLLVALLGVPIQGATYPPTIEHVLVVLSQLLLLILASLGIGFVISAFSTSDSQAVQLSMLVLLASIFFSGFFLPLANLIGPATGVSLLLPVTYANQAFKNSLLEGQTYPIFQGAGFSGPLWVLNFPNLMLLIFAVIMFFVALALFKRLFQGH